MIKKILVIFLLSSAGLMGMEPVAKKQHTDLESSDSEEVKLTTDLTIAGFTFKNFPTNLPIHLAELSQTIKDLRTDVNVDAPIPLQNITPDIRQLLERVYKIEKNGSPEAKKELINYLENLSADEIIDLLLVTNYLNIRILFESAVQVARQTNLLEVSWDKMSLVSRSIRNDLIFRGAVNLCGPAPGNQLAVCKGHLLFVTSVCVTGDGKIVSGSHDNTVCVWKLIDMTTAQAKRVWDLLQIRNRDNQGYWKALKAKVAQVLSYLETGTHSGWHAIQWQAIQKILDE